MSGDNENESCYISSLVLAHKLTTALAPSMTLIVCRLILNDNCCSLSINLMKYNPGRPTVGNTHTDKCSKQCHRHLWGSFLHCKQHMRLNVDCKCPPGEVADWDR